MYNRGGRWGTRHSTDREQLQAVINAAQTMLDDYKVGSAKALLRAFSSELANDWPSDGHDLAKTRPDLGQKSSEVVE